MSNDFFDTSYDVMDTIAIGDGTILRLVKNQRTKAVVIQSWSSLSKQWNVMYRYGDMPSIWASWKKTEKSIGKTKPPKKKRVKSKIVVDIAK